MAKPTLIMIHGFRGTHQGLALIARRLEKDYTVIVPDLPGFAKGDKLEKHDLNGYVTWLETFMKQQSLKEKPLLLGHSFGSIVASAYVAKHPRSVSKLLLVNPIGAPALKGPQKVLTKLVVFYYRLGEKLPERTGRWWLGMKPIVMIMSISMAKTKDRKLRAFIHDQHLRYFSQFHTTKSVMEGFETSIGHTVGEFAKDIPVPTLIIAATLDDITPLNKQYELLRLFPKASLATIDNVGHLTHYETPGEVVRIIKKWLSPTKK
jgi:pimeloyl-ACP methyl ester carboxylesterase